MPKAIYRAILPAFARRPAFAVLVLVAAFAATGFAVAGLGEEFMPSFQENDFLMHWVEKPGTSLEAMVRITEKASKDLRGLPGVKNFGSHIGRAEVADEVVGPNFTELWISVDPKSDTGKTMASIHEALRPGGQVVLVDFHRIEGKSSEWVLGHVRAGQDVFVGGVDDGVRTDLQRLVQTGGDQVGDDDVANPKRFER